MENLLIITFGNKSKATEGLNRLKDLDQLGDITIYNRALIQKTGINQYEILEHEGPDTESLPATGALGGAVIGALGGPLGMSMGLGTSPSSTPNSFLFLGSGFGTDDSSAYVYGCFGFS